MKNCIWVIKCTNLIEKHMFKGGPMIKQEQFGWENLFNLNLNVSRILLMVFQFCSTWKLTCHRNLVKWAIWGVEATLSSTLLNIRHLQTGVRPAPQRSQSAARATITFSWASDRRYLLYWDSTTKAIILCLCNLTPDVYFNLFIIIKNLLKS